MKLSVIFLLALFLFVHCYGQDAPTAAPAIKTFALDPDITGAASNSVNLFTGDVALPLNLVSLPGQNGLDVNVSIAYSSNVQHIVDTWNLEAPTGILGLGWSMDIPKIVADNKQTGTREDDTYYLLEGGSSNRLVRTLSGSDADGDYYVYETKNYQFWKIRYYYDISEIYGSTSYGDGPNKWEITKEDGTKYIYGDKNSGRNTLQYTVRWQNWIGNSAQIDNQSQLVHAWNLSEIINTWNNRITFEYDNVEQFVGSTSGQKQTEASYLKEIIDTNGKKISFFYNEKDPQFYLEPHTEQPEPDAYQEFYETRYLDHIDVLQETGMKMFSTHFAYRSVNPEINTAKMLLASIVQMNNAANSLPPMQFSYYSSGDAKGLLQQIVYPTGGSISYTYTPTTIARSDRKLNVTAPMGYGEAQVYFGADYVAVTWRALGAGNTHVTTGQDVKLYVYQWVGEWKEQFLQTIGNVELETDGSYHYYKSFQVITEDRFFAVLSRATISSNNYHLFIRHKDEGQRGVWGAHTTTVDYGEGAPTLLSGENFVAVGSFRDDGSPSHLYTFLGDSWRDDVLNQSLGDHYYTSADNYLISHNRAGVNGAEMDFHYLTEDKKWTRRNWPYSWLVFSSADRSYWYGANSYALAMASSNPEYIYQWDLTYTNFSRADVLGTWVDESFVFNVSNSLIGLFEKGTTVGKPVRFDGKNWITSANFNAYYQYRVSYGDDYAIWTVDDRDRPVIGYLRKFNPNSLSWSDDNLTYTPNETLFGNLAGHNPVRAGANFFCYSDRVYFRKPNGIWSPDYTLTAPSGLNIEANSVRVGTDKYFIYRYSSLANVIQFLKNGAIATTDNTVTGKYDYYAGPNHGTLDLVRGNTLVTYPGSSIKDATSLALYRVLDEKATGTLVDYPVTLISTDDGLQDRYTSFEYNSATATFDVSGTVANYHEVSTIPGSSVASAKPHGYTNFFFFNGLTSVELGISAMPVDLRWSGLVYETDVFDASNLTSPISTASKTYSTYSRDLLNDQDAKVDVGYYVRPIETTTVADGMETKSTNESYHAATGLVKQVSVQRGSGPIVRSYLKYWWEVYDNGTTPRSMNLLTPVVQTKKAYSGQTVEVAATRWKNWTCAACASGTSPAPFDSYAWKRNGVDEFSAWNETDVVDATGWRLINSVEVNDKGQLFQTSDISGRSNTTLWHPTRPYVLADISNATLDQVLYENFEECAADCSTEAKTGQKSSQAIYNVVLPGPGTYTLSYWSKTTADWSLNVSNISSNTTIGGSGALIDEVRLHPQKARMITYSYDDFGNLTSICDENNEITCTEYDEFNRARLIRDTDGNVMERHTYNFKVN